MTPGKTTRSVWRSLLQSGAQEPRANCGPAISFHVAGVPAPKGSRIVGHNRRGQSYTRPASRREKPWTEAVALVARANRLAVPLLPPYAVELAFAMPCPARPSHPHPTRGDLDKLVRAVLDGLTRGGLILDDRHVTDLAATKRWASPGAEGVDVTVHTLPNPDRKDAP